MNSTKVSKSYAVRRRYRLWERAHQRCVYCNNKTWVRGVHTVGHRNLEATVEHIIPQSLPEGTNRLSNVTSSCALCNGQRGTIDHELFKHIRKQEGWNILTLLVRHNNGIMDKKVMIKYRIRLALVKLSNKIHRKINNIKRVLNPKYVKFKQTHPRINKLIVQYRFHKRWFINFYIKLPIYLATPTLKKLYRRSRAKILVNALLLR